jgi:hypothetical protein
VKLGRGVEGFFDLVESATAGTALIGSDAFFGKIGVGEGGLELLAQIRLGFREFRENQDASVVPGTVGIQQVLVNPGDETFFRVGQAGVREAAGLACQCRDKTPAILPTLPIRSAVSLGGDAVGTLQ